MRIVNPSFGIAPVESNATEVAAPIDWLNDPIVLFGNNKPNARELLEGLREKLAAVRRVDNVEYIHKDSASQPAPPEMLDMAARKYRIALHALGD